MVALKTTTIMEVIILRKKKQPITLKEFTVLHPKNGEINTFCEANKYIYVPVFKMYAEDINDVFKAAQNDFNPEYRKAKVRNTCVGDCIVVDQNIYRIKSMGIELITKF